MTKQTLQTCLLLQARYYPTLYACRADMLDHLFLTNGNGYHWEAGGLTDGIRTNRTRMRRFLVLEKQLLAQTRRQNAWLLKHGFPVQPASTVALLPRSWEDCRAVAADRRRPEREAENTLFYPICQYSACNTVPDDVRPDGLAGVRETLHMVLQWDTSPNVEEARTTLAELAARFGQPQENK